MDLSLKLLGRPAVTYAGTTHEPRPGRVSALLLHLAAAEGWVPREDLMFLLWPDVPEDNARNNLRQLLHRAGQVDFAADMEREASRVRWDVPSDLRRLREAIDRGANDEVVDSYEGPLLTGYRIPGAPEFDSWLEMEREELHAAWRDACLEHANALRGGGQASEAALVLDRVRSNDPLDEEVLRAWMSALADAQRRADALAGYEAFAQRLFDELEIEPEPATLAIAEELRTVEAEPAATLPDPQAVAAQRAEAGPRPRPLPKPNSPFVGRRTEIATVRGVIEDAGRRLVSLVAPGGMGKTRLALATARELEATYADGVAFASFASIETPQAMGAVLAEAMGLGGSGSSSPRDRILAHAVDREMLIVLDNLEHLTEDLSLLVAILEHCPDVTLLATSRERLRLAGEWVIDVSGLSLGADEPDATRLLLQEASRVRGDLDPSELDPIHVSELCRIVDGMPLAIELAAAWLRVLDLSEVVSELRRDSSLLRTDERAVPERHRSIDAVFDGTWSKLRPSERRAWASLALFEGSFDRDAAGRVADVGVPLLLALANKAILARSGTRFDLHPLVKRYGRDRATELGLVDDVHRRIAEHYLPWFAELAPAFRGPDHLDAFARTTQELPNLRAAWIHATDHELATQLADAAIDLMIYFETFGRQPEFIPLADATVDTLGGDAPLDVDEAERLRAIARVYPWAASRPGGYIGRSASTVEPLRRIGDVRGEAYAHIYLAERPIDGPGWIARQREVVATGTACFERLGDEHGIGRLERLFAWDLALTGYYDEAQALLERAAQRFQRAGDTRLVASAHRDLAPIHIMRGDLETAAAMLARTRAYEGALSLWDSETDYLGTLQWLEMERGDYEAAERAQDAYFAAVERVGKSVTNTRTYLRAGLEFVRGAYAESRAGYELLVEDHPSRGHPDVSYIIGLVSLARIALRTGRDDEAPAYLEEAFAVSEAIESPRFLADTAVGVAELLARRGETERAERLLAVLNEGDVLEHRVLRELEPIRALGVAIPHRDRADGRRSPEDHAERLRVALADVLGADGATVGSA